MRESNLFHFTAGSDGEDTPSVFISIPNSSSAKVPSPLPSWSGLANQLIAWRLTDATELHLQHIVTHATVSLIFSAPLSTRPLFHAHPTHDPAIMSLLVACHTSPSAPATFLHLHISRDLTTAPARPYSTERHRYYLPSVKVTAIKPDGPDAVLGLSDGRCLHFPLRHDSTHPRFLPLVPTPLPPSLVPKVPDSMADIAVLQQSAFSSSSSMSFVTRLFKSKNEISTPAAHFPEVFPAHTGPIDPVITITVVHIPHHFIATLHLSGRICLFMRPTPTSTHSFVADIFLPCHLSTTRVQHFLLPGPESTVLALVLADEHPSADSLRIFELAPQFSPDGTTSLSCRQLLSRDGPIPTLVAAAFFAEDVVVATPAGVVTALLNEPSHNLMDSSDDALSHSNIARDTDLPSFQDEASAQHASQRGLPGRTLWTAVDDVDEKFGLGRSIDCLPDDGQAHLLCAHRFSPSSIAKAIRLQNASTATRDYVYHALAHIHLEDEENGIKRIKHRAEQITKAEELRVCDISWDETVGLVVARKNGIHIMRPLFDCEKRVYAHHDDLLTCDQETPRGSTAWLLASHAACQNVSAQYLDSVSENSQTEKVRFMLSLATRFSQSYPNISMTDLFCRRNAEICMDEGQTPTFPEVMVVLDRLLQPGAPLLAALYGFFEMETLGEAAEHCADILPISSAFANGFVWLHRFEREKEMGAEADISLNHEDLNMEADPAALDMLNKAFAFFVLATQSCSEEVTTEDVVCALGLAGYPAEQLCNLHGESTNDEVDWRLWEIPGIPDATGNVAETVKLGECAFWLMEKALRMTESFRVPKTSAAVALEAMKNAPNKQKHEQMRTKAFNHFLDAGDLRLGLDAILSGPFHSAGEEEVSVEEAEALKDSIGHFINRTADENKLKWLAEQELPEPLRMLCGQALERRARGVEVLALRVRKRRHGLMDDDDELEKELSEGGEYEDLYAWHVLRGDHWSASVCALEWAERLADEGPELVRNTVNEALEGQARTYCSEMYVTLLLEWASAKCQALSCVQTAMRVEGTTKYVSRSRFSLAGREFGDRRSAVVNIEWVSRRLLLSHAQRMYLARLVMDMRGDGLGSENVDHLASEWSPLLKETRAGVEWVSSMIRQVPTFDDVLLCGELCSAWREEIGDAPLVDVVGDAARAAARKEVFVFEYRDLDALLRSVDTGCKRFGFSRRNWYTIALDNALSTCAGRISCPKWLIDAAVFGTDSLADDERDDGSMPRAGDMLGAVRVLLRNHRPVDAAKVLLQGLSEAGRLLKEGRTFYVSYTVIDATLETLHQMAQDYSEAELYYKKLLEQVQEHIGRVKSAQNDWQNQTEKAVTDGVGRDLREEFGSAEDMDVVVGS